jgi:hypothetical protein
MRLSDKLAFIMNETKKDIVAGIDESIDKEETVIVKDKVSKKPSLIEEIEGILGGTVIVNLVHNIDVVEESKSIISDEWVKKVKEMTDNNYHTEAQVEAAKILGDKKMIQKTELVVKLHELEGMLPKGLGDYSYSLGEQLDAMAKHKFSDADYEKFSSCF